MKTPDHPIQAAHPLTGQVDLSTGSAPTPYHVYDGHGLLILGTCDASALAAPFGDQDVSPVLTRSGRGILLLFVCDFAEASHGPHLEFHITALAAPNAGERLADDPAQILAAIGTRTDWGVLSLHLWNDTEPVVAYNSEYLGLGAARATGDVTVAPDYVAFDFKAADRTGLINGQVRRNKRSDVGFACRVMRALGLRGLWRAARQKAATAYVINRKSGPVPRNGRAKTLTAPDKMAMTPFDASQDRLDVGPGPLSSYGFDPQVIEHVSPFRFVYLHPDHSGG